MKPWTAAQDLNRAVAERINAEALRDPSSPYAGKFIGVVGEVVVVAADSVDELGNALDLMGPEASDCFCIEVGRDYDEVEYIWSAD